MRRLVNFFMHLRVRYLFIIVAVIFLVLGIILTTITRGSEYTPIQNTAQTSAVQTPTITPTFAPTLTTVPVTIDVPPTPSDNFQISSLVGKKFVGTYDHADNSSKSPMTLTFKHISSTLAFDADETEGDGIGYSYPTGSFKQDGSFSFVNTDATGEVANCTYSGNIHLLDNTVTTISGTWTCANSNGTFTLRP